MRITQELEQQIQRIIDQFPWYQSLDSQLHTQHTTALNLEHLPLLTSTVLEKYYYTLDHPFSHMPGLHCYQTSGTSGNLRKNIYYSDQDEKRYTSIKANVISAILHDYPATKALIDMGTGHAAATAEFIFQQLGLEIETVSFRLPIEQHLERLTIFRPDVLYTMPSILERILLASIDPAAYGIRKIILVGEVASPSWQQWVANRLDLNPEDITDTYGSIEIGTIARYDHELGRYIIVDGIFAEGLTNQQIGEDLDELVENESVLVLTSTVREWFPAIRFVTYDVVRDFQSMMVNGQLTQSFHSIVRRIGNEIKHGEKISIYDIENVVYRHIHDASIRVLTANNALTIQIISNSSFMDLCLLEEIQQDISKKIPEIGMMIKNGLLQEIRVVHGIFDDTQHRNAIKLKRIHTHKDVL
jgi:phenylacetate-coenzyme A ligase PaaK-like adenylate-forming protein